MSVVKINISVRATSIQTWETARQAGLSGDALETAAMLGCEHVIEYDLNVETGFKVAVAVDGRRLCKRKRKLKG